MRTQKYLMMLTASAKQFIVKIFPFVNHASVVLGLTLWMSTSQANSQVIQNGFTLDGLKIVMVPSEMNYSGFTYFDKNGLETTVSVPHLTKAMIAHYGLSQSMDEVDEVESNIGVAVIAENKLWFGMSFYGGLHMRLRPSPS